MRKASLIILMLVLICFVIPIIFTTRKINNVKEEQNVVKEEIVENYDYSQYKTVKLLHAKTNKVETVNLDEYICNVVSAEMPANYQIEALKAQAIIARTYTMYKIVNSSKHKNADICDDSTCCQAWISKEDRLKKWDNDKRVSNWNKIVGAVNGTLGKIVTYKGKPINAFFHSCSGGMTEIPLNVWGGSGYPYLQAVATEGEENYSQYNSSVTLKNNDLVEKIKKTHKDVKINFKEKDCIKILERTDSNRVKTVKFGNVELSGVETRTLLGLRSANFSINIQKDSVKFDVIGYGHGVGMSQTGADALAKQGKDYEEIIKHFYTGVEITDM